MLAGCPKLLSPRHRLKSEFTSQFQTRDFDKFCSSNCKLYQMGTQRLDLPCNFSLKEVPRSQPQRTIGLTVEPPLTVRRNVRIPRALSIQTSRWEGRRETEDGWRERSLKRIHDQTSSEESGINRVKRKKDCSYNSTPEDSSEGERFSLNKWGSGELWFLNPIEESVSVFGNTSHEPNSIPFSISSSTEVQIHVVSSIHAISPLPFTTAWVEPSTIEGTDKNDRDSDKGKEPKNTKSTSSSSSDTQGLSLNLNQNFGVNQPGSESKLHNSCEAPQITGYENVETDFSGLELLNLLVACAESIVSKNLVATHHYLSRLGEIASPRGTPVHRLVAYFTEAITLFVPNLWPRYFRVSPPRDINRTDEDMGLAFRLLNHITPIPKFIHFTLNEILLRTFEGKDRVHIIDFDIRQGLQWPSFFQSLASKPNRPSHVRITGIGESKEELYETRDRLVALAESLNLPFEFHPVIDRLEDVRLWMLHVKDKECVAVNCIFQLHKTLYDGNGGALRDLLTIIRSTNPAVILITEQEAEHNVPRWEMRLSNSLKYYSAIFDAIDSCLFIDSSARIKVEEMFAREIRNIIACEGTGRVERHESFVKWRRLMGDNGLSCIGIKEREMLQAQMLLKMFSCESYSVKKTGEDHGGLTLFWQDQPLYTVSAWADINAAGSFNS